MQETHRIAIAVQRRGRVEQFELPLAPLRVGSASYCDVRLAPDEAAPEQLAFEPRGRALWVRALASEPHAKVNGQPLSEGLIESRAVIELGSVLFTVGLIEVANVSANGESAKLKKLRQYAMLLAVAAMYYFVLHESPPESALARPVPPASLFPEVRPDTCRHGEREAARSFAEEQRASADSKRERSPFSVRDGVLAVPMYEMAAACFRRAGDAEQAADASRAAQQLARKLEEELQGRQVRLEWFLNRGRYRAAAEEVVLLREMLLDRSDPYTHWLSAVARELRTILEKPKET